MKTEKLHFDLPSELIAQEPSPIRGDSRLLVLNRATGELVDSAFNRLQEFLRAGDCLVLNDTKVLPARFFARRKTTAKIEGLFLADSTEGVWEVLLKGAAKLRPGEKLYLKDRQKCDFCKAELIEKKDKGRCRLKLDIQTDTNAILARIGFPPLPPYIKRDDNPKIAEADSIRYQTVYARNPGAVAAPTAGLHFTKKFIKNLNEAGVNFAYLTLNVGIGTFKPITTENIEEHKIHQEQFSINNSNAKLINRTKDKCGRIVAVGTTTTRVLETVAEASVVKVLSGSTDLFIKPGYKFKVVDAMITNFHLPRSTLLALVAAFAGFEKIMAAYNHAIEQRYRFYSYGDAMMIV